MSIKIPMKHSALIAAILCGTTASADVTAQQVWDNWTSQMSVYGQGFTTGGETMSGDTLTISDVRIEMSDEESQVTAELGDINLTENGDGTVSITTAESYPMTLALTPQFDDPVTINLTISQTDMVILASGEPGALTYDITGASYGIALDSVEGEAEEEIEFQDVSFAMLDLAGSYSVTEGDVTDMEYDFGAGQLVLNVQFSEAAGDGYVDGQAVINDMQMAAKLSMPPQMDMDADMPPFDEGLAFEGGYTFGALAYEFDFAAEGEAASGTISAQSGMLDFAADFDGVGYTGGTEGIAVNLLVPNELPFPIDLAMASYGFDIQIPLSQNEDGPRDARFAFDLTELSISDTIWNLVDPQTLLPRDAITVALGLDAQVTPFFDFMDAEQQDAIAMAAIPGELNSVTVSELTIKGAGAEILGDGSFTFDNTDMTTFPGFPRPEGEISFAINGVNGLVDTLIQMGVIPQEEAMMPRMMLGMFATPVGDDMLTSTIEVNPEGHVLANGQRLR